MMEDKFVSFKLSTELQNIGFKEDCVGFYALLEDNKFTTSKFKISDDYLPAPTYEQAFDWLEKFDIYGHIEIAMLGSDEWEYCYVIDYLPKEFQSVKRRSIHFKTIESLVLGGSSYDGAWSDKKRAKEECLRKMIQLCEKK